MEKQLSEDEIINRVKRIVGEVIDVDPGTIEPATSVYGDKEGLVAGLFLVQVHMSIEEEFQLEIPDVDMECIETVQDYVDYLRKRLNNASSVPPVEQEKTPPPPPGIKRRVTKKATSTGRPLGVLAGWEFDQGHWERIEDSLSQASSSNEQAFRDQGYTPLPILCMGIRGRGVSVEVYAKEQAKATSEQRYYVRLWLGSAAPESIYASNLPSLLTLLNRFGSIIAASHITDRVEDS